MNVNGKQVIALGALWDALEGADEALAKVATAIEECRAIGCDRQDVSDLVGEGSHTAAFDSMFGDAIAAYQVPA